MPDKEFVKYLKEIEKITLNDFASKDMSIQEEIYDNYLRSYRGVAQANSCEHD